MNSPLRKDKIFKNFQNCQQIINENIYKQNLKQFQVCKSPKFSSINSSCFWQRANDSSPKLDKRQKQEYGMFQKINRSYSPQKNRQQIKKIEQKQLLKISLKQQAMKVQQQREQQRKNIPKIPTYNEDQVFEKTEMKVYLNFKVDRNEEECQNDDDMESTCSKVNYEIKWGYQELLDTIEQNNSDFDQNQYKKNQINLISDNEEEEDYCEEDIENSENLQIKEDSEQQQLNFSKIKRIYSCDNLFQHQNQYSNSSQSSQYSTKSDLTNSVHRNKNAFHKTSFQTLSDSGKVFSMSNSPTEQNKKQISRFNSEQHKQIKKQLFQRGESNQQEDEYLNLDNQIINAH